MSGKRLWSFGVVALAMCSELSAATAQPINTDLQRQVIATETAFAKTMADRNFAGFTAFISDEAVFFSGAAPLHGKAQVIAAWKPLYEKPRAPFSWAPSQVEVLPSGTLALSTGDVRDAAGKVTGTFTSIWRLEGPRIWRIVFDKGDDACVGAKP